MKPIIQIIILSILFSQTSFANIDPEENIAPITLDEATKKITKETQNKVLNAETKTIASKKIHVIKILTDKGRIQHIKIEAKTGKNIDMPKENSSKDE